MPVVPKQTVNINDMRSVDIMNAVRSSGSNYYRSIVPEAGADTNSIRQIGETIMGDPLLYNEFLPALINRIGRVIITSKLYRNPWEMFKKGLLEFGETIEEVFVNIAKPFQYDPEKAVTDQYKRVIPDVRSAFHVLNYQKFYKVTVSNDQLRQAFLSWTGITDLIARIIDTLYTGANYDEFLTMKYMLARQLLNGGLYPYNVPAITADNAKSVVTEIKGISNDLEYLSTKYNPAGVLTYTDKRRQILIMNAKFDAVIDVNVLASAFNMEKAEFMGNRVMIDSFGSLDVARLNELLEGTPGYVEPSADELKTLDAIPAVLVDADYFMVFDNLYNMTEKYNAQGLYWNYFYHVWKTFSTSPFANAIVFTPESPAITSVTVSPGTATVSKGQKAQFSADVVTTGFAPSQVTWAVSGTETVTSTVSQTGVLQVASDEANAELTVTAQSIYDSTKSGTATVTVA